MPNTTKSFDIKIGGKFYKTITVTGGYNFSQISQDLHGLQQTYQLSGFDLTKGVEVVPSTGHGKDEHDEHDGRD